MNRPITYKVDVLTGKRGGYGAMRPMLKLLTASPNIDLKIIVTDQHLDMRFGMTIQEVLEDFSEVVPMPMFGQDGTKRLRAQAMCSFGFQLSNHLHSRAPDLLVLYGDRSEILEAASIATIMNIPICHIQGGDLTGNIDEHIRHAVTKLSHVHLVSNSGSKDRLIKLGEQPESIHVVGDHHVDEVCRGEYSDPKRIMSHYGLAEDDRFCILLQHSETLQPERSREQILMTLEALDYYDGKILAIYPCSDAGYEPIVEALEESSSAGKLLLHKNIIARDFWGLLSVSDFIIGNSSCGIIEARYFDKYSINIGGRQSSRLRPSSVIDCDWNSQDIRLSYRRVLKEMPKLLKNGETLYGNGNAAELSYSAILKTLDLGINIGKKFYE